jgi:hypothetical protein
MPHPNDRVLRAIAAPDPCRRSSFYFKGRKTGRYAPTAAEFRKGSRENSDYKARADHASYRPVVRVFHSRAGLAAWIAFNRRSTPLEAGGSWKDRARRRPAAPGPAGDGSPPPLRSRTTHQPDHHSCYEPQQPLQRETMPPRRRARSLVGCCWKSASSTNDKPTIS